MSKLKKITASHIIDFKTFDHLEINNIDLDLSLEEAQDCFMLVQEKAIKYHNKLEKGKGDFAEFIQFDEYQLASENIMLYCKAKEGEEELPKLMATFIALANRELLKKAKTDTSKQKLLEKFQTALRKSYNEHVENEDNDNFENWWFDLDWVRVRKAK